MSSFKSNENIHKKEDESYYVVSANKTVSDTPLIWDAAIPKNRYRNRKLFSQACFLFQDCLFKSSFEMRFLF